MAQHEHSVNLELLTKAFPKEAIKRREGGRGKQLDYVEGHTVIRRLNEATSNNWNLEILSVTSNEGTDRSGKPTEEVRAHVRLTVPGLGSREHVGVQTLAAGSGEDLYKGVITDALKKAATLFGVGLELYGPDYVEGVANQSTNASQPAATTNSRAASQRQLLQIRTLARDTDTAEFAICQGMKVERLEDLSVKQADVVIDRLEHKAADLKAASS